MSLPLRCFSSAFSFPERAPIAALAITPAPRGQLSPCPPSSLAPQSWGSPCWPPPSIRRRVVAKRPSPHPCPLAHVLLPPRTVWGLLCSQTPPSSTSHARLRPCAALAMIYTRISESLNSTGAAAKPGAPAPPPCSAGLPMLPTSSLQAARAKGRFVTSLGTFPTANLAQEDSGQSPFLEHHTPTCLDAPQRLLAWAHWWAGSREHHPLCRGQPPSAAMVPPWGHRPPPTESAPDRAPLLGAPGETATPPGDSRGSTTPIAAHGGTHAPLPSPTFGFFPSHDITVLLPAPAATPLSRDHER